MSLINLILKLLLQYVPFEVNEFESLQRDATSWWSKIVYPPNMQTWDNEKVNAFMKDERNKEQNTNLMKLKYYCDQWYCRVIFSVGYIWLFREIQSFMNPKEEKEDKA